MDLPGTFPEKHPIFLSIDNVLYPTNREDRFYSLPRRFYYREISPIPGTECGFYQKSTSVS